MRTAVKIERSRVMSRKEGRKVQLLLKKPLEVASLDMAVQLLKVQLVPWPSSERALALAMKVKVEEQRRLAVVQLHLL